MAPTTEHQPDERVDDLRQQLRALGYLDAGVDRFVLGPARSMRSPWSIAALSSLRVGMLAAVLLGPIVAAGIGARLPGLITGPRDAVVVALYLAALFGLAASAFTWLASVLVATLGGESVSRRARFVSRAAGTLVAIGSLAYLTLWWRSANADAWSAPVWTLVGLGIAVLVSILLGHAVAITAFAVISARYPGSVSASPSRSSRKLVIAAGALAFAGAAGLLAFASPRGSSTAVAQNLDVRSPGVPLRVIGLDGFDPEILASLRADGRVPAFEALFARGSKRVRTGDLQDPARAWTTIATGQPSSVHGVHSLETRRVPGVSGSIASGENHGLGRAIRATTDLLRLTRPSIASGAERRAKTFWEVAADGGLRPLTVNWWATWPAVESGGAILSDRAALRLELGGALDAEIAPARLYEQFRGEWPVLKKVVATQLAARLPRDADAAIDDVLRRSAELDALHLAMWQRFYGQLGTLDVMALYLPGLDIAQHALLSSREGVSASALGARLDALKRYYVFLDQLLGDALAAPAAPGDHLLVVITHPGRRTSDSYGTLTVAGALSGSPISGEMQAVDIAPTLLYALGLPISDELPGRPALDVFATEFVSRFPVRKVPSYGAPNAAAAVRRGQPLDEEMIERLRSLGYVR